ncbi:hypothetical protein E7T06_07270 [Deinococcus sp. Arct2-2]|uniref:hypothetical protein n=1 Tax=Deinococcus sp. Arct2-2 TaxID=2568653 RepID=UPI0010A4CF30|nr:hypothetical protein [Deinococcus sp. Arct2-2]THF70497.1 hypothetical protein E7T06_07270 [Deinococcus sp. Arct2-2]
MIFLNSEGVEVDSSGKPVAEVKAEGTSEVDTLKRQVADLEKKLQDAQTGSASEVSTLKTQVADLTKKAKDAKAEGSTEAAGLKTQVTDLNKQLKEAKAKPALPEDARDRLVGVDGINEALADKALAALAAK